ncbi:MULTISPECIES: NAD(P)H-binding protein [Lactobacillaceae]|uniref:NAD(P)H-binding protein n=1 Tax=Lactobacillaceae TaxID=33958 RepID=UPI0014568697|nr:NAD(P)H-binding protein [Lactobacillus sp. HBUAS51381]NLR10710.1 NAD(P)H-binding protein [Lactobacillus sp. HBUAS51381]
MKNVLILGAHGRIARIVERRLIDETDAHLTLVLRNADRLKVKDRNRETIVEGDVSDFKLISSVMAKQDIVYANLAGNMESLAKIIVRSMVANQVKQLVWVTGSGLYHETPEPFGSWVEGVVGHASKEDTRKAARIIEKSVLQYTIIRAAYMTDDHDIDYELTQKGEQFKGVLVSRASIADLILNIITKPRQFARTSVGISKPGTDDKLPELMARYD